jgi:hypothetical protein
MVKGFTWGIITFTLLGILQKSYTVIEISLHNILMLVRVWSLTCHAAYLHKLASVSSSMWWSSWSSEEWHIAIVHNVCCIVNIWFVVIYATCQMVTNWHSLDTCQLLNILRKHNMQADLNMLNGMTLKLY